MNFTLRIKREISKALSGACIRSTWIKKNKMLMKVPLIHGVGASNHMVVDERMTSFVKACAIGKKGLALDVGANVGVFLIQLNSVRWFEEGGAYLGFEPNPLCTHYVNELTRLNHLQMAECVCAALAADSSLPVLHGHRPADKMASLTADFAYRSHRKEDFSVRVIAERGDVLLARMGSPKIAVLKIDVEGHEGDVLAGLAETLEKSRPWIFCEMWDLNDRGKQITQEDLRRRRAAFDVLSGLNYVAYGEDMQPTALADISLEGFSKIAGTDVIFVPDSETASFQAAWQKI